MAPSKTTDIWDKLEAIPPGAFLPAQKWVWVYAGWEDGVHLKPGAPAIRSALASANVDFSVPSDPFNVKQWGDEALTTALIGPLGLIFTGKDVDYDRVALFAVRARNAEVPMLSVYAPLRSKLFASWVAAFDKVPDSMQSVITADSYIKPPSQIPWELVIAAGGLALGLYAAYKNGVFK